MQIRAFPGMSMPSAWRPPWPCSSSLPPTPKSSRVSLAEMEISPSISTSVSPGDGWSTAWATNTTGANAGTTLVGNVVNTAPLNGGGNYLSTTLTAGAGAGNGKGVEQRQYTSFGNVSLSQIHTVSFDFRLDSSLTGFDATGDYIQAFDRPVQFRLRRRRRLAHSRGGRLGEWQSPRTNWMFYNGGKNGVGFNNANFVDSGVTPRKRAGLPLRDQHQPRPARVLGEHQWRCLLRADGVPRQHSSEPRKS